jgi:hypothetical protein
MESTILTTKKLMIKKIFGIMCLLGFWGNICAAQSITNWGESVHDVQLSITLSNNIINIGSTVLISAIIQNLSTNVISLLERSPLTDFNVTLSSSLGKEYKLTPDRRNMPITRSFTMNLNPGEVRDLRIVVTISKDIKAGDYTLKAKRNFISIGGDGGELVSNPLKVHIQ